MELVKVLNKGQIVIPAAPRKKYAIRPGIKFRYLSMGD